MCNPIDDRPRKPTDDRPRKTSAGAREPAT